MFLSLYTRTTHSPFVAKLLASCILVLGIVPLGGLCHSPSFNKRALPSVQQLSDLNATLPVKENITKTMFMFRGDFSSPFTDIFTLHKQAVKVCDKDVQISGCDVKLNTNYKWSTLALKMADTLSVFCGYSDDKKTDFYVKIDDDLIMSPSELDDIIRHMAATPCQYAGGMYTRDGFYWATGQIYIFTRAVFDEVCKQLPTDDLVRTDAEDVAFGGLVNTTDPNAVCGLDAPRNHWHGDYEDQRVKIHYVRPGYYSD